MGAKPRTKMPPPPPPPPPSAADNLGVGKMMKKKSSKSASSSLFLLKHPGAAAMALLSVVFCIVITVWQPLGPEKFARLWFQNGGFLPQCNKALAFAKLASELRCYSKSKLLDGSVNRGLFGLNSKNTSHITDKCAYDCTCSLQFMTSLSNAKDRQAFSRFINNTGVDIAPLLGDTGAPCNVVAESLILEGWSMLQIKGTRSDDDE